MNRNAEDAAYRSEPPEGDRTLTFPFGLDGSSSLLPRRQPLLYLLAAFAAGILADRLAFLPQAVWTATFVTGFALSTRFVLGQRSLRATLALLLGFASAGALTSLTDRTSTSPARLKSLFDSRTITEDDPVRLAGRLARPPEPAPQAFYVDLEAESVEVRGQLIRASGRARLIVPVADRLAAADFERLALDHGTRINLLVKLDRAKSFSNPGSPDFNEYLERQGYDLKGTIKSPLLIENHGAADSRSLLAALYRVRLRVLAAIDSSFEDEVSGTLKAMMVDNRHYLSRADAERLREGGTFHILSISGMHVDLIAWVLLGGSTASFGSRRRRSLHVVAALVILWGYAVMVGLAPPVTRATLMITIGLIGPVLFRRAASINTVAGAAFLMLAMDTSLIADPGFQLSFMAVAAIVTIALPVTAKLKTIGEWRPSAHLPHPPFCPDAIRIIAESLFWNERRFRQEIRRAPVRYRLDKSRAALLLGRVRAQALLRSLVVLFITSLAIQAATFPLSALYFNRATAAGVLLNIATGLLTAVMMLAAVLTMIAASISTWAASQLAWITETAHYMLVNSVSPFSDLSGATFRVAHYEDWRAAVYSIYFIPLALAVLLIDRWRPVALFKKKLASRTGAAWAGVSLALLVSMVAVAHPPKARATGRLAIHFLDVGQGDSTLIVFPKGTTMLVDGGGEINFAAQEASMRDEGAEESAEESGGERQKPARDNALPIGEIVVSRFLWSKALTSVDYLLATHSDADHMGGLSDVAKNFEIGQAVIGRVDAENSQYAGFARELLARSIPVGLVNSNQEFDIDGATVEVLWPRSDSPDKKRSANNDSIVLRIVYGQVSVLLTGDIERETEDALARSGVMLRSDVLKVPHHGSKTSSTDAFLSAVDPRIAVIQVGKRSRFGHPHPIVIERYLNRSARIFQTGRDGTVTVETDGHALEVKTYLDSQQ